MLRLEKFNVELGSLAAAVAVWAAAELEGSLSRAARAAINAEELAAAVLAAPERVDVVLDNVCLMLIN